jgi:RimJ/RimL family protein N-acetyltransferase
MWEGTQAMDEERAPAAAHPDVLVRGERAALGVLRRELLPEYQRWWNNVVVLRDAGRYEPRTLDDQRLWYERAIKAGSRVAKFTVYDGSDFTPVGVTGLSDIDARSGTAELGVLIGDRQARGIGTDAARLTVDWGFNVLGLHNILATVYPWNQVSIDGCRKLGFQKVGTRRGARVVMGQRYDALLFDLIRDDFKDSILRSLAPPGGSPA